MADSAKPTTTPAPPKRDDATDSEVGKLVQVDDASKLTNADINGATADGLKESTGPKADAATGLAQARDDAKSDEVPAKAYNHGMGPGVDI